MKETNWPAASRLRDENEWWLWDTNHRRYKTTTKKRKTRPRILESNINPLCVRCVRCECCCSGRLSLCFSRHFLPFDYHIRVIIIILHSSLWTLFSSSLMYDVSSLDLETDIGRTAGLADHRSQWELFTCFHFHCSGLTANDDCLRPQMVLVTITFFARYYRRRSSLCAPSHTHRPTVILSNKNYLIAVSCVAWKRRMTTSPPLPLFFSLHFHFSTSISARNAKSHLSSRKTKTETKYRNFSVVVKLKSNTIRPFDGECERKKDFHVCGMHCTHVALRPLLQDWIREIRDSVIHGNVDGAQYKDELHIFRNSPHTLLLFTGLTHSERLDNRWFVNFHTVMSFNEAAILFNRNISCQVIDRIVSKFCVRSLSNSTIHYALTTRCSHPTIVRRLMNQLTSRQRDFIHFERIIREFQWPETTKEIW